MKKAYAFLIVSISCTQLIHSMESTLSTDKKAMSEQLYNRHITEKEIKELIKNGADVNYHGENRAYPVPIDYAERTGEQALINMQTIILNGAHLDAACGSATSPLYRAAEINNTQMVLFLLDYENKEIFVPQKWGNREEINNAKPAMVVDATFVKKNFEILEKLITQKFITPDFALTKYNFWQRPSIEIVNYLVSQGATNLNTELKAFIDRNNRDTFVDFKIDVIKSLCESGAYNADTILMLKEKCATLNLIIKMIEKNNPTKTNTIAQ